MSLFNGLTHAVLYFNSRAGLDSGEPAAAIKLCFGSDNDFIAQLRYVKTSVGYAWALPMLEDMPIFNGMMASELLLLAGKYSDVFKAHYDPNRDGIKAGRVWRVSKNAIQEIKQETKQE